MLITQRFYLIASSAPSCWPLSSSVDGHPLTNSLVVSQSESSSLLPTHPQNFNLWLKGKRDCLCTLRRRVWNWLPNPHQLVVKLSSPKKSNKFPKLSVEKSLSLISSCQMQVGFLIGFGVGSLAFSVDSLHLSLQAFCSVGLQLICNSVIKKAFSSL